VCFLPWHSNQPSDHVTGFKNMSYGIPRRGARQSILDVVEFESDELAYWRRRKWAEDTLNINEL
jgi:hypothetical protein